MNYLNKIVEQYAMVVWYGLERITGVSLRALTVQFDGRAGIAFVPCAPSMIVTKKLMTSYVDL